MPESGSYQVTGLRELTRALRGTDRDIRDDVRKVNRKWTNVIRDKVRAIAPRTGGSTGKGLTGSRKSAKKKTGPQHDTRTGAFKASVKSKVSADYGVVLGGGPKSPHFVVNEFGGAVWWEKGAQGGRGTYGRRNHRSAADNFKRSGGKSGHIIPVRERSPQTATSGRAKGKFPRGWYFYPTIDENVEHVFEAYWDEMCKTLDRKLH